MFPSKLHELHVEAVVLDLLFADVKGLALALFVDLGDAQVVLRGDAHHGADGRDDLLVRDEVVAHDALGELEALGGLDDDVLPYLDGVPCGGEVVGLAAVFEFHADDFCQFIFLIS